TGRAATGKRPHRPPSPAPPTPPPPNPEPEGALPNARPILPVVPTSPRSSSTDTDAFNQPKSSLPAEEFLNTGKHNHKDTEDTEVHRAESNKSPLCNSVHS